MPPSRCPEKLTRQSVGLLVLLGQMVSRVQMLSLFGWGTPFKKALKLSLLTNQLEAAEQKETPLLFFQVDL
jgi:hypothetical protein